MSREDCCQTHSTCRSSERSNAACLTQLYRQSDEEVIEENNWELSATYLSQGNRENKAEWTVVHGAFITPLLPSIMCFCLQHATSQLASFLTAFESYSPIQMVSTWSQHWPVATAPRCPGVIQENMVLHSRKSSRFCWIACVTSSALVSPFFCALNVNTFHT